MASASAGALKSEVLATARGCYFVLFPTTEKRDRLLQVKPHERWIGERLLQLCRGTVPGLPKLDLQVMCEKERTRLRLLGSESAALAADAVATKAAVAVDVREHDEGPPSRSDAPVAQPSASTGDAAFAASAQLVDAIRVAAETVDAGRVFSCALQAGDGEMDLEVQAPARGGEHSLDALRRMRELRALAMDIRGLRHYLGIFAFVVYALLRRVRVHLLLGDVLVDIIETYAPWAADMCAEPSELRCAVLCRCAATDSGDRLVFHCESDRNLLRGNHWMPVARAPWGPKPRGQIMHAPCGGRICDPSSDICHVELYDWCRSLSYQLFPCVANGDCGVDCMARWDGSPRNAAGWKALRVELSDYLLSNVENADILALFTALGEESVASEREPPPPPPLPPPPPPPQGQPPLVPPPPLSPRPLCVRGAAAQGTWRDFQRRVTAAAAASGEAQREKDEAVCQGVARYLDLKGCPVFCRNIASMLTEDERALVLETSASQPAALQPEPRPLGGARVPLKRCGRTERTLGTKRILANLFIDYCKARHISVAGRCPYGVVSDFWKTQGVSRPPIVNHVLLHWARTFLGEATPASTDTNVRKRKRGGGRPYKATPLREALFDWFCCVRGAVRGRIPLVCLRKQAELLRDLYVREHIKRGTPCHAPIIKAEWLRNWRREYGVSLRMPNRKWKVSRAVLKERLEIMWLNVIRVRALIKEHFGYDPVIIGFDQKPFHMNEGGSQNKKSLAWRGAPVVALKECHGATRSRWSVNTSVTSDPAALAEGKPPWVEIMFKGGAGVDAELERIRVELEAQYGAMPWLSFSTSEKGSYRREHIIACLQAHLEPWSEGRDWRIIMCDAYGPHLDAAVFQVCWERGYILLTHGGGTTAVAQVNDVTLHRLLSDLYTELEMRDMLSQHQRRPHKLPLRSRRDCASDLVAIWRDMSLHQKAAKGHWFVGLANALDGTEDEMIADAAKVFWEECDMATRRTQAVEEEEEEEQEEKEEAEAGEEEEEKEKEAEDEEDED